MPSVWRIATDSPTYTADDLTGAGARISGGRWNHIGAAVVYASNSIALACLETVVHLNTLGLPANRYLMQIDIPDDVWTRRERYDQADLPLGWDAIPAGKVSRDFGSLWLAEQRSALLLVPSIVVPEESNVLLNPAHGDAKFISCRKIRKWTYDPRLRAIW